MVAQPNFVSVFQYDLDILTNELTATVLFTSQWSSIIGWQCPSLFRIKVTNGQSQPPSVEYTIFCNTFKTASAEWEIALTRLRNHCKVARPTNYPIVVRY